MQHSQEQARRGVELANEAGAAILGIRESTHKVVEAVQQFSRTLNADLWGSGQAHLRPQLVAEGLDQRLARAAATEDQENGAW